MRLALVWWCSVALFSVAWGAPPIKATQAWRLAHEPQLTNVVWSARGDRLSGCIDGRTAVFWSAQTGEISSACIERAVGARC